MPVTRGSKKDSDGAITPVAEAVHVPAHLALPRIPCAAGSPLPRIPQLASSCATFSFNSHWDRTATGKKKSCIYARRVASVVSSSLRTCRLWPARLLSGEFSRQEYWSVWANTGRHPLLEHCISCCPNHQLPSTWCCQNPCDPSICTTPHTWPSQRQTQVLQGSPRSKPQWTTHMQKWK